MIALSIVWHNFVCIHKTVRFSPAMAASSSKPLWSVDDVVALIEARMTPGAKRGSDKPRNPKAT